MKKLITIDHRKAWVLFKGDKIVYATDEEEFRTLFFLESAARRAASRLVEKTGEDIEVTAVEIRRRYRRKPPIKLTTVNTGLITTTP